MIRPILAISLCALLCACAGEPAPQTIPLPSQPPAGEPRGFIGMSASGLLNAFGSPTFVRKENGSAIWRYDEKDCRAFFFLYAKGASQVVRHVETIPRGTDIAADPTCLASLHHQPVS
ncbi:MAG: hypothetical protein KGI68_09190 [Alphaproteobacteria bacterium]|nr:hypothetical protein [Alphaproteobacteria bacterium]MDE1986891.1 hypothetical protein [Alphaproteobacteria bacterium]MDE2161654.1 hypothetical protein [Alphaproteobacteria bacterium]MDE2266704.1 hypothetical protein [Alphaproteobacteria bacterium]MDE2500230.1 hypothetical protein [Alphaproteobacteria bacterium]